MWRGGGSGAQRGHWTSDIFFSYESKLNVFFTKNSNLTKKNIFFWGGGGGGGGGEGVRWTDSQTGPNQFSSSTSKLGA